MWYFVMVHGIISLISNIKEINGSTLTLKLHIDPELNVTEGVPMELKCTAPQKIESCVFKISGLPSINQANSTRNAEYKFVGSLEDGVCSVRVFKAKKEYQGEATCSVTYPNNNNAVQAVTTYVKVSSDIPPSSMQMTASNRYYEFKEGQEMTFVCTALHGTSPPNISIYLENDLKKFSNDLQSLSWNTSANHQHHNNKKIACEVAHRKLENAMSFSRSLTVFSSSTAEIVNFDDPHANSREVQTEVTEEQTSLLAIPELLPDSPDRTFNLFQFIQQKLAESPAISVLVIFLTITNIATIALLDCKLCSGSSPKQSNVNEHTDQLLKSEISVDQVPNASKQILQAGSNNRRGTVV